jgi:hypothetical protein
MKQFPELSALTIHSEITATGTDQASAWPLPYAAALIASVVAVDGGTGGVMLHPQTACTIVSNTTMSSCSVWPPPGFSVGGGVVNAAYSLGPRTATMFYRRAADTFESIRLGAVS